MEETIKKYFSCWLNKDSGELKDIFADNIIYSECYGPEYRGIEQILWWFNDWNETGTVLKWDIKQIIFHENTLVAEWYFECEISGNAEGFDGVTIAKFDADRKIYELKEFQSKAEHYYPYGG